MSSSNYFKLLGFALHPFPNQDALRERYLALSREYHPDHQPANDLIAAQVALKMTAEIAKGYEILKDPLKAALHFLELSGISIKNENPPAAFLMGMMDLNEALDEENEVEKKMALWNGPYQELLEAWEELKMNWDAQPQSEKLKELVLSRQYLQRIKERMQ